jgi:hypothetical protein
MTVGAVIKADAAGRDLVAGDVALGAGWGTSPVLAIQAGSNQSRGVLTITADATAAQATATVTVTFPKPFDEAPTVVVSRHGGDAAAGEGFEVVSTSTTDFVAVKKEIPVDTEVIGLAYVVVG